MSILRETSTTKAGILQTAAKMMIAARTSPKGKGRNTLEIIILTDDHILKLAEEMKEFGKKHSLDFFERDANNILKATAIVIIGTKIETLGLNEACQLCGFENCSEKEKYPETPCVFNTGDLHLALGSSAAIAASDFVDNRIMFSVGKAAVNLGLFGKDIKIAMGIPLASLSKNPFFDRK